jgi:(1->4)-alpha-D-glucan 1-alpha-D-glucosylmutase
MSALDQLCAKCGIEPAYWDIWGNERRASDETRLALLNAMGVRIAGPAEAEAALRAIEDDEWRSVLPPVQVTRHGTVETEIVLVLADPPAAAEWTLELESGERSNGRLAPEQLRVIDRREVDGARFTRCSAVINTPPLGYHKLTVLSPGAPGAGPWMQLVVCPARCFQPATFADERRLWGLAIQLYAVRSRRNWGMGDFTDLRTLMDVAAGVEAGVVGLNPLHELFPCWPRDASPYSPSSRSTLNALYIDVEAVPDYFECEPAQERVRRAAGDIAGMQAMEFVDYARLGPLKIEVLKLLHHHFRDRHLARDTAWARAFRAWCEAGGERLQRHALFDALNEHFCGADGSGCGWLSWDDAFRDPDSAAVAAFARGHGERIEFYQYLQWLADMQLAAVAERARSLRMPIGLYQDLAVGSSPSGAEAWIAPALYALQARVGAPPDDINLKGQEWGLPPWIPQRLKGARYAPFIQTLRASMRHAGALRVDHVMALMRLYWVPLGESAASGTYVSYPLADLLGILALESQRHRCLVIGEDLGTVPDAIRAALADAGVLSYRPLYFQREADQSFLAPERYPAQALVAVSTHDLPTLKAYWRGEDLELRRALALFPSEDMYRGQAAQRNDDRARLARALQDAGLIEPQQARLDDTASAGDALWRAVHAWVARAPSRLMMVQAEDVFGQLEQVNLPGMSEDRYPNWRRKLPVNLEDWTADARMRGLATALREARGYKARSGAGARLGGTPARPAGAIIPRATYRIQFHRGFTFAQATAIVPYLAALGVSHVYASPYLKARAGSTHGYDIIDHNALNPEIGTTEEFEAFAQALAQHGMGQMLDIVPNHMGVMGADNGWWLDVLENGPAAAHAAYFDIDWQPPQEDLRNKVLVPVLGDPYSAVLEKGELVLAFNAAAGTFHLGYHGHRFPIDPGTYPAILGLNLRRDGMPAPPAELGALIAAFRRLPGRDATDARELQQREHDKEALKQVLANLCTRQPEVASRIAANVEAFNGAPGEPASFDRLHALIDAQAYRLAHWRVAADDVNYRRFFDINDLAALRIEHLPAFEDTHRLVLDLYRTGRVDGLRIDHPDGLSDPKQYFERLQRCAAGLAPDDPGGAAAPKAVYVATEKIIAEHERLPEDWPVHGTTGYRYLNVVNGLFVDGAARMRMDRTYRSFAGLGTSYEELLHDTKVRVMTTALAAELNVLANTLNRIAKSDRRNRDFTLNSLRRALIEVAAAFPVYRTYATVDGMRPEDRRYLDWAIARARKRSLYAQTGVFDLIRAVLSGGWSEAGPDYGERAATFIARFQQFTAPVMAKAMEDTSFYIYNRLVSLNEVGGDPRTFGMSLNAFHAASQDRAKTWPHTMLATSTHDNKRSEDVRARVNVLSEMPAAWRLALRRWSRINRRKKTPIGDESAPSANDEYLLYQTLLGAWPLEPLDPGARDLFRERIQRYMLKAAREAKTHTSWVNPAEDYEQALAAFIDALLKPVERNPFVTDFLPAQARVARYGMLNSLSQTLIKYVSPGVPDLYQGNELWDFSLVDPDNRRPVDYARRTAALAELQANLAEPGPEKVQALLDTLEDGRTKLYVTWKALALRARHPDLFQQSGYTPLHAEGEHAEHVCAFARTHAERTAIAIAPRLIYRLTEGDGRLPLGADVWGDTRVPLPDGDTEYLDELTGARLKPGRMDDRPTLRVADVLANFPVALLTSTRD